MIHGYDDSTKEKIGVITLTKSIEIEQDTYVQLKWNYSELEAAGIDTNNLSKYAILEVLSSYSGTEWDLNSSKGTLFNENTTSLNPHVRINTSTKEIAIYDNGVNEVTGTKYYKLRLMRVES